MTTAIIHPWQARVLAAASWASARDPNRHRWGSNAFWAAQAAASALQALVMEQRPGLRWDPDPVTAAAANRMAKEMGR
jgi:hypothetical protein